MNTRHRHTTSRNIFNDVKKPLSKLLHPPHKSYKLRTFHWEILLFHKDSSFLFAAESCSSSISTFDKITKEKSIIILQSRVDEHSNFIYLTKLYTCSAKFTLSKIGEKKRQEKKKKKNRLHALYRWKVSIF